MDIDPQSVKYGFDALKSALETIKSLKDVVGSSKPADGLDARLVAAEKQIKFAEAQIAQALGYELCRAHFPPVPMLLNRIDEKRVVRIHKCPECAKEEPPPEHFAALNGQEEESARFRNSVLRQGNYDPFSV